MSDLFTLEDLTIRIYSQRENDPTNDNEEEGENNA
jgi:hypothetical protein